MLYALNTNERFAAAHTISAYSPEMQSEYHNHLGVPLSAESLTDELLGLRFPNGSRSIAVPYLKELIQYAAPNVPYLETAADFARTPDALAIAKTTIQSFEQMRTALVDQEPQDLVSISEVGDLLQINRPKLQSLMELVGANFSLVLPSAQRGRAVRHVRAVDLERLYQWQYPASFPDQSLRSDRS